MNTKLNKNKDFDADFSVIILGINTAIAFAYIFLSLYLEFKVGYFFLYFTLYIARIDFIRHKKEDAFRGFFNSLSIKHPIFIYLSYLLLFWWSIFNSKYLVNGNIYIYLSYVYNQTKNVMGICYYL